MSTFDSSKYRRALRTRAAIPAATHAAVRAAFDQKSLRRICTMGEIDFAQYGQLVPVDAPPPEDFYIYCDRGADVLAVAHLDSVEQNNTCTVVNTQGGPVVFSGALDDRLGAYVILDMLPKLGVHCDVLLTTGEESGRSTAQYFTTDRRYNWLIQFDRGGTDVVMYDYETSELRDMVEATGADVGNGSYSDICMLEHLGCKGINWGVGYQDYHGPRAHAWLNDTFRMVAQFVTFHAQHSDTHMPHEMAVRDDPWWVAYRDDDPHGFAHGGETVIKRLRIKGADDDATGLSIDDETGAIRDMW